VGMVCLSALISLCEELIPFVKKNDQRLFCQRRV
jgi:hypothetical protein